MHKSLIVGLVGICSSIFLTLNEAKAAKVNYKFDANYTVDVSLKSVSGIFSSLSFQGTSDNTFYGLNTINGKSFVSIDTNGSYIASTSPAYILEKMKLSPLEAINVDDGLVVLGSGLNKLYLHEYASGALDMSHGTGFGTVVLKIFGGEGLFSDATGYIDVLEYIKLTGFDEYQNLKAISSLALNFNVEVSSTPRPIPESNGVLFLLAPAAMIYGLYRTRTICVN